MSQPRLGHGCQRLPRPANTRVVQIISVPGAGVLILWTKALPKALQALIRLGLGLDASLFAVAGRLEAQYRISLADPIALAPAIKSQGALLTCDHHEFDILDGKEPVQFCWIG